MPNGLQTTFILQNHVFHFFLLRASIKAWSSQLVPIFKEIQGQGLFILYGIHYYWIFFKVCKLHVSKSNEGQPHGKWILVLQYSISVSKKKYKLI